MRKHGVGVLVVLALARSDKGHPVPETTGGGASRKDRGALPMRRHPRARTLPTVLLTSSSQRRFRCGIGG